MAYHQKQPWESHYSTDPYAHAPTYSSRPSYPMSSAPNAGLYQNQYGETLPARPSKSAGASQYHPANWSRRQKLIVGGVVAGVILLIIIIVAAVEGTKANAYPSYDPLDYTISDSFDPPTFFSNFDYFNNNDPAGGHVVYDNPIDAQNRNLTGSTSSTAWLKVSPSPEDQGPFGGHSARINSKKSWQSGLFLFDVKQTPYGCGTWPAVWLSDAAHWPHHGEIDVIEAVNQGDSGVQTTLHSAKGCTMDVKRKMTGKPLETNCFEGADANAGCGVQGPPSSYGKALNDAGGAVFAAELRADGIRSWFFPRSNVPGDVQAAMADTTSAKSAHPDPSKWPQALADFPKTDCDIGSHFNNQSIVVNIDLCGQWAGRVYSTEDKCPGQCTQYVSTNPAAFATAEWNFGSFKVFQAAGSGLPSRRRVKRN